METSDKIFVFLKVARLLNQQEILWAVGASFLLYCKGILPQFQDVDILVEEKDAKKVKKLLDGLGRQVPQPPSRQFATAGFYTYEIEGLELDIIAGFTIVAGQQKHYFPLLAKDVETGFVIEGVPVPLHSLQIWENCYRLMGRTQRAQSIQKAVGR